MASEVVCDLPSPSFECAKRNYPESHLCGTLPLQIGSPRGGIETEEGSSFRQKCENLSTNHCFRGEHTAFHQTATRQASIRFPCGGEKKILETLDIHFPSQQKWPLNSPAKDTEETERRGPSAYFSGGRACARGDRAAGTPRGEEPGPRGGRGSPRCGEGPARRLGEPAEGARALRRDRGGPGKFILTQFRNCAAPAGRPAGALGTRRRPSPPRSPVRLAPRAAARPAPDGGPGALSAHLPAALGE